MQDLRNNIESGLSLVPAARNATANGTGIDLQGYEGALAVVCVGALTDGTHTFSLEHSDVLGSGYTAVTAVDMLGSFVAGTASSIQSVGYIGMKRYLRVVQTVAGATTGAVTCASIARGMERHKGNVAV